MSLSDVHLGEAARPATPGGRARPRRGGGGSATWRFVGSQVLGSFLCLIFVLVLNFFLFRVLAGDPVRSLGRARQMTPEAMADLQELLGLNEPLWKQFFVYLKNTATGELGVSYATGQPVADIIASRMGPTLLLVGSATILATIVGVWMGIRAAWRHGGLFDRTSTFGNLVLYSAPEWWLGMVLLAVFAVGAGPIPGIFPVGGLHSPDVDPSSFTGVIDTMWHLALPVTTLTLGYLADFSLVMRSSLLDEMGQDYLTTARAKGLRDDLVRRRHAVPNALLPTTTLIALSLGFVVGGAVTIETVFSIEGLGLLLVQAVNDIDRPLMQGIFLTLAVCVIVANLIANLLYGVLDPRVRTRGGG
jgi:peptide/nickel transport system permease protein